MTTGAIAKKSPEITTILFQKVSLATNRLNAVWVKNKKKSTFMPKSVNPMKALKKSTVLSPNRMKVILEIVNSFSLG